MRIRSTLELGFRLGGSSTGGYSICSRVCGHSRTGVEGKPAPIMPRRMDSGSGAGMTEGGREGVEGTEVVS